MSTTKHSIELGATGFDVEKARADFPILSRTAHGKPLVYLDNAATAQSPRVTIDTIGRVYSEIRSNVHRGVHFLSERATEEYENAREIVRQSFNAARVEEVIFLRGTTEAINLVASTYGRANVGAGDEIIISALEHHSNIVPWQMLCEEKGARLRVIPMNERGELLIDEYRALLNEKTRIVAVNHISNALGTINPIRQIAELAHAQGAVVVIDGAQAMPHLKVDVQALGVDFFAFSGHKAFGPTGIGALYGKYDLLDGMPPYQGGGEMIKSVTFEGTIYNDVPYKFEAGTPNIVGAIALGATLEYLNEIGKERITAYERELLSYATESVAAIPGITLIGTAREKAAILSFLVDGIHAHDVGSILDREGVAVRTGHHCAQPVMDFYNVPATARASIAFYNNTDDIDTLVRGIYKAKEIFA